MYDWCSSLNLGVVFACVIGLYVCVSVCVYCLVMFACCVCALCLRVVFAWLIRSCACGCVCV